jgi:hypothetical protein
MQAHRVAVSASLAILTCLAAPMADAEEKALPPTPEKLVAMACDAAGGRALFSGLGVVQIDVEREEATQEGKISRTKSRIIFTAPGPVPGRVEIPESRIVVGSDGVEGWATVGGRLDSRPSTPLMARRLIATDLFPLMLPFSLTWDGVTLDKVLPAEVDGQPLWRLLFHVPRGFFHPQVATNWTVDVHQQTFALVRAESPFVDLGSKIQTDGMLFTFSEPANFKGTRLHAAVRVNGFDEFGRPKAHTRSDRLTFSLLAGTDPDDLFVNPIPPELRPKLPIGPPKKPEAQPQAAPPTRL